MPSLKAKYCHKEAPRHTHYIQEFVSHGIYSVYTHIFTVKHLTKIIICNMKKHTLIYDQQEDSTHSSSHFKV